MVTYNASYFTSLKVSQWLGLVIACPPVATFKMFLGGGECPKTSPPLGPFHTVYYAMLIVVNYMTTTGFSRFDSRWTNVFPKNNIFFLFYWESR